MNALLVFGTGLGAILLLLASVMTLLLRPLSASLQELCGAKERGDFWIALSEVALATGTLLSGLLGFWWVQATFPAVPVPELTAREALFWSGVAMVRSAMAGLALGLIVTAAIVLAFTARLSRGILPAPQKSAVNE